MLMVIFGAGASYDSSAIHPVIGPMEPKRPPLANFLFADRREFHSARNAFPQLHALIPQLIPHGDRSIEQTLQRYTDEAPGDLVRKQQLVAVRYYLQALFRGIVPLWLGECGGFTNYESLLEQIRRHRKPHDPDPVCLVTFNYDILLELALTKRFKMQFDVPQHYIDHPDYKVFKLHGSQNWGRYIESAPTELFRENRDPYGNSQVVIENANRLRISPAFAVYETVTDRFSGPPLYPAVAIPVTSKTDSSFECPAEHLSLLTELVPRVTKVLAIGWRGREQHFLDMLRGLRRQVAVTAVAETVQAAEETLGLIKGVCDAARDDKGWAGFSAAVRDGALEGFLAA